MPSLYSKPSNGSPSFSRVNANALTMVSYKALNDLYFEPSHFGILTVVAQALGLLLTQDL